MGDEAVIPRIAHGRIEKPVDDQDAGVLVELVLDGFAPKGHFDDDIDVDGRIVANGDGVQIHQAGSAARRLSR